MPLMPASLCHGCAHLAGSNADGTARCAAFDVIPARIWSGEADHRRPVSGDGGTTFSPLGDYGRAIEAAFLDARTVTAAGPEAPLEAPETPSDEDPALVDPTAPPTAEMAAILDAPPEEWHAVLVVEGTLTGDRRFILPGALTVRPLPLPGNWQEVSSDEGHEGAFTNVCQITRYERIGSTWHAWGHYLDADPNSPGATFRARLREAGRMGVSVDMDDATIEVIWPEDDPEAVQPERVEFSSARIMGFTVVSFPAFAEAYIEDLAATYPSVSDEDVLLAAAIPVAPPAEWFANPGLTGPTPLTVTDEGRVFGHLAAWGTCHTGFQGTCVEPPYEDSMPYFTTGEVACSNGERVPVGQITLGTGHADHTLTPALAVRHYDHTGSTAADVAAGPDEFGIWLAGALRPGTTPEDVRALRAAAVSGDWRRIGGALRLLGVLAVNVPGFPVPRTSAHVSGGTQTTLVAAGVVRHPGPDLEAVAEMLAARVGRDRPSLVAALEFRVHREPSLTEFGCQPCAARAKAAAARAPKAGSTPESRAAARTASLAPATSYEVIGRGGVTSVHGSMVEALKAKRAAGPGARMRLRS